jgi:hypothetical protein
MRAQFLAVTLGLGVSLGCVAFAEEFPTTILPAGCAVQAAPDGQNLCHPLEAVFDLNGIAMLSHRDDSSMHAAGMNMGTFGLNGSVAIPSTDDALIALWRQDVTSTGSTAPAQR